MDLRNQQVKASKQTNKNSLYLGTYSHTSAFIDKTLESIRKNTFVSATMNNTRFHGLDTFVPKTLCVERFCPMTVNLLEAMA